MTNTPHQLMIDRIARMSGASTSGFKSAIRAVMKSDDDFADFDDDEKRDALRFLPDLYRIDHDVCTLHLYEVVDASAINKHKLRTITLLFDIMDGAGWSLRLHVLRVDGTGGEIDMGAVWTLWLTGQFDDMSLQQILYAAATMRDSPSFTAMADQFGI